MLAAWTLVTTAQGQTTADSGPSQLADAQGSMVFLLAPDMEPVVRAALIDAVEAHLTGTGTTLHWHPMTNASGSPDLRAAIEQGKPVARAQQAAGVFWLDASDSADWLLYLMNTGGDRIVARRLEGASATPSASVEAVALIVRESAAALIAGLPIAMDPVAPPATAPDPNAVSATTPTSPTTETTPANSAPGAAAAASPAATTAFEPGALRVSLAYLGTPLSNQVPWQHGLSLRVLGVTDAGWFAGLGFTLFSSVDVDAEDASVNLQRRPFRAIVGGEFRVTKGVRVALDLSAIVDFTARRTTTTADDTNATDSETQVILGGGVAARIAWALQPTVDLFVGVGVDGFLNRFDYVVERDGDLIALVSPWAVSPAAELGLAFRP